MVPCCFSILQRVASGAPIDTVGTTPLTSIAKPTASKAHVRVIHSGTVSIRIELCSLYFFLVESVGSQNLSKVHNIELIYIQLSLLEITKIFSGWLLTVWLTFLVRAGGIDSKELSSRLAPLATSSPDDSRGGRRRSSPTIARASSSDVPLRGKRNSGGELSADGSRLVAIESLS